MVVVRQPTLLLLNGIAYNDTMGYPISFDSLDAAEVAAWVQSSRHNWSGNWKLIS